MQVTIDESTTTPLLRQLEKYELDVVFVSSMYLQNGPKENYQTDPRYLSLSFSVDPYYVVVSRIRWPGASCCAMRIWSKSPLSPPTAPWMCITRPWKKCFTPAVPA